MQVTSHQETTEGNLYQLSNGDALLMKATHPVYVFANGRRYSARTGRFSAVCVRPAVAAMTRYLNAREETRYARDPEARY